MKREFDIYVVDDDKTFLFVFKTLLEEGGYKVKMFHSSSEVITALKASPPKLLILDLVMPVLSGDELMVSISELKLIKDFIPIMISAVDINERKKFEYHSLGLDIILSKSISKLTYSIYYSYKPLNKMSFSKVVSFEERI